MNAATFAAAEMDENTDITNKAQIYVVLWYVNCSCEVKGAFFGLDNVINDKQAQEISEYALDV